MVAESNKLSEELIKGRQYNFSKFIIYSKNVVIISIVVLVFLAIFNS